MKILYSLIGRFSVEKYNRCLQRYVTSFCLADNVIALTAFYIRPMNFGHSFASD